MLEQKLKGYDKYLYIKKELDGSVIIYRQSPFSIQRTYKVLTLQNQYIGSGNWVIRAINLMDTQKYDIAGRVLANNKRIREEQEDSRINEEVADLLITGSKFIN